MFGQMRILVPRVLLISKSVPIKKMLSPIHIGHLPQKNGERPSKQKGATMETPTGIELKSNIQWSGKWTKKYVAIMK